MGECLLQRHEKLCYASAIYRRVLAICNISGALKNVILSLRTVDSTLQLIMELWIEAKEDYLLFFVPKGPEARAHAP